MELTIQTIEARAQLANPMPKTIYLRKDHWNDFSFITMFQVHVCDESGVLHDLGSVKIGFKGQTSSTPTYSSVQFPISSFPEGFFSLGVDVDYYSKISEDFSDQLKETFCVSMQDVVFNTELFDKYSGEEVFRISLLRSGSVSAVKGQFARVLAGGVVLTEFDFLYTVEQTDLYAGYELDFTVKPTSKPPTNIHAVIGRNGAGKTTFLNDVVRSSFGLTGERGSVLERSLFDRQPIDDKYFSGVVSVSFSAFDPFSPPQDRPAPDEGPFYHYIGIKDPSDSLGHTLKSTEQLRIELVRSIKFVLSEDASAERWREAIQTLESDSNFREIDLQRFANDRENLDQKRLYQMAEKLSSGHAIVLLTMTKLVSFVQEKTLVLIDEPEGHLHPPLLSALTRSLSNLLYNRNGVAIIATHSPVVLQEIPRSCVWKIVRSKNRVNASRPDIETFAENVGTLTREVFALEVANSGFHKMLTEEVEAGKSFAEISSEYGADIGFEGQALVHSLLAHRDRGAD